MYVLNRSASSLNKYANYADLFNYVNIKNAPIMTVNAAGKMDGQYLIKEFIYNNPNRRNIFDRLFGFIFQQKDLMSMTEGEMWNKITTYIENNLLDLTRDPNYPNKDKFEMPFKVVDMVCFIYDDEMQALAGNNSSKYTEIFGSDEKIIEYMMDMVVGMKLWMADIAKNKPIDSEKLNDLTPTANAIILHPIYMFRWMEKMIQENKPMCTDESRKTHTNQNECYQTIPTSQSMRRRASYVEPSVVLNNTR